MWETSTLQRYAVHQVFTVWLFRNQNKTTIVVLKVEQLMAIALSENSPTRGSIPAGPILHCPPGLFGTEQHSVFAAAGIVSITENLARIVDSEGVGERETGAVRNQCIEID